MIPVTLIILVITIIASLTLQVISLWPGLFSEVLWWIILSGVIWFPLLVIMSIVLLVFLIRKFRKSPHSVVRPLLYLGISAAVLLFTILWIYLHGPLRIAFHFSRGSFDNHIGNGIVEESGSDKIFRVSVWNVQKQIDPRGGYYFRIDSGPDAIGPDIMSYGFVYKPNVEGSPFGNAKYRLSKLDRDWFFFSVSDDW